LGIPVGDTASVFGSWPRLQAAFRTPSQHSFESGADMPPASVAEAMAERLRVLLRSPLVCVLLRQEATYVLRAAAAENPQLAAALSRNDGQGLHFAADLASRAVAAGEPISATIDPVTHSLEDFVPAGMLVAAPFTTSLTQGAVLVYPRHSGPFSAEERLLISTLTGFGALAITQSELLISARSQPVTLPQSANDSSESAPPVERLAMIAVELNAERELPEVARRLIVHALERLGARSAALAVEQEFGLEAILLHGSAGEIERGHPLLARFDRALAEAMSHRESREPITTAPAAELLGASLASELEWAECALVPLTLPSGEVTGVLCLANFNYPITPDDQQDLLVLARTAAVAVENARLFTRMERANRNWIEIFDAIGDFIVAHDESDRVLRVNRTLAEFIGVEPAELIGVSMAALLAIGEPPQLAACPFCRSAEEAASQYVHPVLERTYLVSTSRVQGAGKEGTQTVHVLRDISDRREAEQRYRELFDNIQEGLFFATPEGRFVEVNDALVRMLGYQSRDALLQIDLRTQIYSSQDRYRELVVQMQHHGGVRNHEETLRRQDGSLVYVLINAFAVRDGHGRIVQHRGVMLDISGLRSFQAELQRERDFTGKILNNTQSLILVADTAGLISYANRRWCELGYEQIYLVGQPLEELIAPAKRQLLNEAFATTLAGSQVDNLDLQVLRGDGSVGQFSVNLSPMRDEQGNVASLVVVMTDVTEATTLQSKLMHAEKMAAVGQLVSGVAHEVNNPLTAILGFADLLMENPDLPESARKDLRVILQEAQRTKQIVQNLLSFARQMPPQRKPVQLNSILRRTVQLRSYDFQSHGIQVIERFDQSLPNVIGDAQQLQQVFLNILNNASDAVRQTGRPARIEIVTSRLNQGVEVTFRDNGQGIAHPERIFDPFFTTKEVGKGTGLGLSICYGIVREHGGEILCRNNSDQEGATFLVRLPIATEAAVSSAAAGVVQG